jgi:hypothetical protein
MIPVVASDAEMDRYVSNIIAAYQAATPQQAERGRNWYPVAHDLAVMVGHGDVRKGAGIIAALSVQKPWDVNVKLAEDAANGDVHGHTRVALGKVEAMIDGADPAELLPMQLKTGNFWRCIVDPADPDPVVIDRHAHDVAAGERFGNRDRGLSNTTRYATLALAYRLAARQLGVIPSVVQAVVWVRQTELNSGEA